MVNLDQKLSLNYDFQVIHHPRPIPEPDSKHAAEGWILFLILIGSAAGPWQYRLWVEITRREPLGIGNWKEEQFIKAIKEGKLERT